MTINSIHSFLLHIAKFMLSKEYRLLNKIKQIPRYTEFTTKLLGKTIKSTDSASYIFTYNEIFKKLIYKFTSEKKNPNIIDCGANIGLSIIYFKQLFPEAKIFAFEPDKKIFEVLSYNIQAFNLKEVTLYNKAVWNEETILNFYQEGADGGRISSLGQGSPNNTMVQTIKLKDYLHNNYVDFLKIDIEGAETAVLKDCENELKQVERIFVEYHSFENKKQSLHEILRILDTAGFRIHALPVSTTEQPFIKRNSYLGIDMQFNIFGFRN